MVRRATAFVAAWFGGTAPAGLRDRLVHWFKGVGLSTTGDTVNLFNSAGKPVTGVQFGAATTGLTFLRQCRSGLGNCSSPR